MPTPTPPSSPSVLFNFPFANTLGPTLAILLQIIALSGAIYGFIRGVRDAIGWLRRPRLKLYMSDDLWLVAEDIAAHSPYTPEFAINIQFVAFNPGKRMAVLRRLEGSLIRPESRAIRFIPEFPQKTFALVWRHFIKGSPSGFEQTEPVFVKPVTPENPVVLAVQLRGNCDEADLFLSHFVWCHGRYTLHLYGDINRRRIRLSPRSGFTFQLSENMTEELSMPASRDYPFTRSVQLS